jgi:putative membrane protein
MNAFSTATVAALLAATATLANAETYPQMHFDTNAASSQYQHEALRDASTPTAFASSAAQTGMIEIALGGLALQKSNNSQVRQFAQKMIRDHGQANLELDSIVQREGLILPTRLDAKYDAIVRSFNAKSGAEFDKAYIAHMAKNHADEMSLFESAARLSDPQVAAYAQKTLTMLQEHRQLAENLRATGLRTASAR